MFSPVLIAKTGVCMCVCFNTESHRKEGTCGVNKQSIDLASPDSAGCWF